MSNESPRRLTLLIPGLTGGGAEKVIVRLADHWADEGHRVTLIALAGQEGQVHRPSEAVNCVCLDEQQESNGIAPAIINNWRRIRLLGKAIRDSRPDAVISFTDQMNVLTLLATRRRRFPVIVCERVDMRRQPLGKAWRLLRRLSYPGCDCLVVQTRSLAEFARSLTRGKPVEVLANAVEPPRSEPPPVDRRPKRVTALGRLVPQKGFDLLITAFAAAARLRDEWRLEIYGVGPLQATLQDAIATSACPERILLGGWCDDVEKLLADTSVFVLSSRWEGFPNALLDAMACGAACVSFDCPSGPGEIVRHDVDGLLVECGNVKALSAALGQMFDEPELRSRLGDRAREVVARFGYEQHFRQWNQLIERTIAQRR